MESEIASNVGIITELFKAVVHYVDVVVGGNEFASGLILASVGAAGVYALRTVPVKIFNFIDKHTTVTLTLHSSHESFHQFNEYCKKENIVEQSRYLRFGNGRHGSEETTRKEIGLGTQIIWFGWIPLIIERREEKSDAYQAKELITIKKLGRGHKFFDTMLKKIHDVADEGGTRVYKAHDGYYEFLTNQPQRQFNTISIPEVEKHRIIRELDKFMQSEQWYIDHGIPYQLGILLYGPPGTGKTSLIKAIAAHLDYDIVTARNAASLANVAANPRKQSVIAVEEIDTFNMANRDLDDDYPDDNEHTVFGNKKQSEKKEFSDMKKMTENMGNVVLSEVLNALDGIVMSHGRIVVFTSNDPSNLDPAFVRPGRIDMKIHVGYMNTETFNNMVKLFYPEHTYRDVQIKDKTTPAMVQDDVRCGMGIDELFAKYTA